MSSFETEYKRLNKAQKDAVDSIEGPVMVVAGPGTGKTQILTLRIANILQKTDTPADGILCLTFTNSGVFAMRQRLRSYIGTVASRIHISTFHSFAISMIEEYYEALGFVEKPTLVDDVEVALLFDIILSDHEWKHLRTRTNKSLYFHDIKSLISLLKRERLSPDDFSIEIENEIKSIKEDESNISTRGASKGSLKQEALKRIEGLERTQEVVKFYSLYELLKKAKNLLDFNDVLEELVRLVEISTDARDTIRERYLYILVDEHQDSSGVQNEFLTRVWGDIDKPNIFVVGDDRQLIYGFGGATLAYFESFKQSFGGVKLITLIENYRSTQNILNTADALLKSSLAEAKLLSQSKESYPLRLLEAEYPRDEILRAGLEIKEKIEKGMDPNECAILVPKNTQVRNAMKVLADLGIPVASSGREKFFADKEAENFLEILKTLASPETPELVAPLLLSPLSGISPLAAHRFLSREDVRKLTLSKLLKFKKGESEYEEDDAIAQFAEILASCLVYANTGDIYVLIQKIGEELLIKNSKDHETLTRRVEIIRTLIHLALSQIERNPRLTLAQFLDFIDRLREYDTDIPMATFESNHGVKVMTLHASKGLEFECVYISHLDEKNMLGKRRSGFTLPERVKQLEHKKGEEEMKRELYVAITRAKKHATLSYSLYNHNGAPLEIAHIVNDLPTELLEKISASENEKFIMDSGIETFVRSGELVYDSVTEVALAEMLKNEYYKRRLSVTHINNFFECQWKWYFRNFLQLPEPKNQSLEFGNLVHGTLEKILKKKIKTDKKSIEKAIDEKAETLVGFSLKDVAKISKEATEVVLAWVEKELPKIAEIYESEKSLSVRGGEFDHLDLTGKIDLIEQTEEGVFKVTDFKTGSLKKKSEIEKETDEGRMSDYERQLAMYSYLIDRKSEGNANVSESRLMFVEHLDSKDAVYSTVIGSDHIKKLLKDIDDFDQLLASGEWIHRKCNFKPRKSGEVCEYCKLAEIYKKK
jgi:DNA helicase-2/ATP-dependent DNA helicase PcrA